MPRRLPLMFALLLALLLVPALPPAAPAAPAAAAVPHVQGGAAPRDGVQTLELRELWRRGDEDDDLIFGSISSVQVGPDGNLYVLDQQLSQVDVFAPDGALVRTLSREGEGPGECRQPEHMVFFADGSLGLAQYLNGRIVRIDRAGTPLDTIMPPGSVGGGNALANIRRVRCRGGNLVINGVVNTPTDDGMARTQYLMRCEPDGTPVHEYLSATNTANLARDGWIEKNNWFPSHERWDLDEDGFVHAAVERNAYRISVFAPDGPLVRTFGRDEKPWRRSEEVKQEIRDSVVVIADGQRIRIDVQVEDDAPVVSEIACLPGGETWVLTSRGREEQPAGVMQTYDVFDRSGAFVRRVAVACPGDPDEDRLFLLGDGRAALVRGAVQARRNTFGGSRTEEAEAPVHDLTLYAW